MVPDVANIIEGASCGRETPGSAFSTGMTPALAEVASTLRMIVMSFMMSIWMDLLTTVSDYLGMSSQFGKKKTNGFFNKVMPGWI